MIRLLYRQWWKWLTVILMLYIFIAGLLISVPEVGVIHESIRNLFYHVPLWFGMTLLLLVSLVFSIKYLTTHRLVYDTAAKSFVQIAVVFGLLGFTTGSVWAQVWQGAFTSWVKDPKILYAMLGLLIFLAYLVLRGSITNDETRARLGSIYHIFGYALFIVFIFIMPRLTDSIHPGNGGNPGFSTYDLDARMRLVFYPAVIGYFFLGSWLASLNFRLHQLKINAYLADL